MRDGRRFSPHPELAGVERGASPKLSLRAALPSSAEGLGRAHLDTIQKENGGARESPGNQLALFLHFTEGTLRPVKDREPPQSCPPGPPLAPSLPHLLVPAR